MAKNDAVNKNTIRFQVYLNYVSSISAYLGSDKEKFDEQHYQDVVSSPKYKSLRSENCNQKVLNRVGYYLRNAWLTELCIRISGFEQTDEFIRLSNHWKPVQLYYSAYLAIQAFFVSNGQLNEEEVSANHSKTLRMITNEIDNRSEIFPFPLRVLLDGAPDHPKEEDFKNLPKGTEIKSISPLQEHGIDFWSRYCQFLKTTRRHDYKKRSEEWKKKNSSKKNLSAEEKQKLISNLGKTSFFNCLYRMRTRSNYFDADAILFSSLPLKELLEKHSRFHDSLKNINWHVLLSFELLIAKYLGKDDYGKIVNAYCESGISEQLLEETVKKRWKFIELHT